jgi:hypothetical protein
LSSELALPADEDCDCGAGAALVWLVEPSVRPWNECSATREITPDNPIAPAIVQRLMRETRARSVGQ